jgi:hypothetical protein
VKPSPARGAGRHRALSRERAEENTHLGLTAWTIYRFLSVCAITLRQSGLKLKLQALDFVGKTKKTGLHVIGRFYLSSSELLMRCRREFLAKRVKSLLYGDDVLDHDRRADDELELRKDTQEVLYSRFEECGVRGLASGLNSPIACLIELAGNRTEWACNRSKRAAYVGVLLAYDVCARESP